VSLTLGHPLPAHSLAQAEKVIITELHANLNTICKLSLKEVKELIKQEPE
jgi:hypothetical protein